MLSRFINWGTNNPDELVVSACVVAAFMLVVVIPILNQVGRCG